MNETHVINGLARVGQQVAYVTPLVLSLDGHWIRTQGGKIKIGRIVKINSHHAYEMPTYYELVLDNGSSVDADDAVRIS